MESTFKIFWLVSVEMIAHYYVLMGCVSFSNTKNYIPLEIIGIEFLWSNFWDGTNQSSVEISRQALQNFSIQFLVSQTIE